MFFVLLLYIDRVQSEPYLNFVWSCSSRTYRCNEDLPALLGCAEEGEALMLGGLQDGIPMY